MAILDTLDPRREYPHDPQAELRAHIECVKSAAELALQDFTAGRDHRAATQILLAACEGLQDVAPAAQHLMREEDG